MQCVIVTLYGTLLGGSWGRFDPLGRFDMGTFLYILTGFIFLFLR